MDSNLAAYFLDRNLADGRGADTALVCGDRSVSYAELVALSARAGHVLGSLGVHKGHRVLLALSDGVEFVAAWYGAQRIGAVTAEVYTFLTAKDYAYYLDYTDPAAVIVDATTLEPVRQALAGGARARVLVTGVPDAELRPDESPLWTLMERAPAELDPVPVAADEVAIWKFTTGSTGSPKACVHPAGNPLASFRNYALGVLGLRASDRVLAVPKLFFGYARDLVALFPFGVGGTGIAFPERSTAELLFELIERHRPTVLVNVPTMMSAMVAHPAAAEADLSSLRLATSAGEALPEALHRSWDDTFGVEVVDGIGSSEAYHIYLSNRPGEIRHGSVGRPVPGYTARVLDEAGAELPRGEIGTLEVGGPSVAGGYWDAPEKSASTFGEHTVRTADLFSQDVEGFFTYRGRADELLKVGGVFVAPSEIEHCLLGHPDVLDCAVLGHPDGGLIRPRAHVVLRAGATTATEELREFARARLAGHKCPREFRFLEALPRTANGKLDRRALRAEETA
ncbi:benzoate-CoA ligase family protein [Amycolatopsis cihanbeyliensis]|uniref:Benzoate-CoA ligase family protein n=1 Tax=Amycolatopsis cihanbeyliensis TaxID=1128664 RepID=A0A542CUE3_AMYCI|nr:benzoate-CoA ligase family protein [Amycolatopsis cihanbeyliensis]TQI94445.1 benzoate-CoA ligase family protein [Amycolatopsis cihanbeyliensis]